MIGFYDRFRGRVLAREKKTRYNERAEKTMVAMVKRLSQRVVVPLSRVRFPLATPTKSDLAKGRILFVSFQ